MTLLETLVALVILGLAGVGFLEGFQTNTRAARDQLEWMHAVGEGEAAMEEVKLAEIPSNADVRSEPWGGIPGLELVTVTVPLRGGGSFVLRRLERAR